MEHQISNKIGLSLWVGGKVIKCTCMACMGDLGKSSLRHLTQHFVGHRRPSSAIVCHHPASFHIIWLLFISFPVSLSIISRFIVLTFKNELYHKTSSSIIQHQFTSFHIISHPAPRCVYLPRTTLTNSTVDKTPAKMKLTAWRWGTGDQKVDVEHLEKYPEVLFCIVLRCLSSPIR